MCVAAGSPHQAAALVAALGPDAGTVCYQMDLHQAGRLRALLAEAGSAARVETLPDLWDLPADFETLVFPVAAHGKRELKLDLMEQAYHVLRPKGVFVSLSEYDRDSLLPRWHKKLFGKCSELPASKDGSAFWSVRPDEAKPRRRHELEFHAKIGDGPSHAFLSRPGVFSYGRMDGGRGRCWNAR